MRRSSLNREEPYATSNRNSIAMPGYFSFSVPRRNSATADFVLLKQVELRKPNLKKKRKDLNYSDIRVEEGRQFNTPKDFIKFKRERSK